MKRLIVTADDVGLHRGLTEGAIRAHVAGVVTACSVVANGAAFDDAAERLRDHPKLDTGVHLTLVEERPLASNVPSLTGANGLFPQNYAAFVARYFSGRIRLADVEREFRMQIERVAGAGLRIGHFNGHQHLHLLPRIFETVQGLAEEYGVAYVRIVDESVPARPSIRAASIRALSRFGRRARAHARVRTNERTIGVHGAGRVQAPADFIALLDHVDERTTELVCHPGVGNEVLAQAYPWRYRWDEETAALCDPQFRAAIAERGIELIRPSDVR